MNIVLTDNDLHAYVDGQLEPERRREVEAFLSRSPHYAALVEDYRRQRILLHRLYDGIEEGELPTEITSLAATADRALRVSRLVRTTTRGAAVCGAIALVAGTILYTAPTFNQQTADPLVDFRRQAIAAHLALGDDPLTTDPAVEGASLTVPELDAIGLIPVTRRLLQTSSGAALQIIYADNDNTRVTLYAQSVDGEIQDAAFAAEDGVGQIFWRDSGVAFSLLGMPDEERLSRIADAIGAVGSAMFPLTEVTLDTATSTAVQIELEPLADGTPDEVEALPPPVQPEAEPAADEQIPATQSRDLRQTLAIVT